MTKKVLINKKTGLVDNPIYPCYKGEGLCQLRITDTDLFQCVYVPGDCKYRVATKGSGVAE